MNIISCSLRYSLGNPPEICPQNIHRRKHSLSLYSYTTNKSRKDEHAHIGLGEIGEEGFKVFVTHPKIRDLPLILETPADKTRGHKENIEVAKSFMTP